MTIAEYLKEYRKKMGISQQELAKIFGVAVMTVCRIEGGQNYLSPKVIDRLVDLMKWEDFNLLNGNEPSVEKMKRAFIEKYPEYSTEMAKSAKAIKLDSETLHIRIKKICDDIDSLLLRNDFTLVEDSPDGKYSCDRIYNNELTQKRWAFFFPSHLSSHLNGFIGYGMNICTAIGYTYLTHDTNIRKVSVITELDEVDSFYRTQRPYRLHELPCDFSFIPYCAADFLHTEIDLSLLGDGRGLFDMDSPDADIRTREIERFSKWKRSLL